MSLGATLTALLGGCASTAPAEVRVEAAEYRAAFEAAREVLFSYRFPIERVDARAGVLTTGSKPTSGLLTPWDSEQSLPSQEWEDTINRQQRRVEILFSPVRADSSVTPEIRVDGARDRSTDLIDLPQPTLARVVVVVERLYTPGLRPNTRATALYTATLDTQSREPGPVAVAISDDPPLARRIAREIEDRLRTAGRRDAVPPEQSNTPSTPPAPPAESRAGG